MTATFYRLHANPDAPEFSANNAWSGLWGTRWSADGAQNECTACSDLDGSRAECRECGGTGWQDAQYGYSCCWTADDLIAYMNSHGVAAEDDAVVIFEGQQVGTGFDGEPLAVPTGRVEWTTWGELIAVAA
jgi:hypothetical protein